MINVVCVNCGTKHLDIYVDRLFQMVQRCLREPFTFTCITDHYQPSHPLIHTLDCSGWGTEGWFTKLRLFDGNTMPFTEMLYLDVSLIVLKELDALVAYARPHDFVALHDWHYDCVNSCTMWIRRSPLTQAIWDDYARGTRYETVLPGDQDFINASLHAQGLFAQAHFFPTEWIASYKRLLRTNRRDAALARQQLAEAVILKFHGHPRPHELLNPFLRLRHLTLRFPGHAVQDWNFLCREIADRWAHHPEI